MADAGPATPVLDCGFPNLAQYDYFLVKMFLAVFAIFLGQYQGTP